MPTPNAYIRLCVFVALQEARARSYAYPLKTLGLYIVEFTNAYDCICLRLWTPAMPYLTELRLCAQMLKANSDISATRRVMEGAYTAGQETGNTSFRGKGLAVLKGSLLSHALMPSNHV